MNRSRTFQGLSVALFAVTGGLAAAFAGCGGGTSSTSTGATSGATTDGTSSSSSATSAGSTSSGAGGSVGTGATSGATTSSGSTGGAGGMGPCAGCTAIAVLPSGSAPVGLAIDASNVYWTNSGTNEIMQAKLDGSSPVTLATGQTTPFAVQVSAGFVYWGSYSPKGVLRKTPIGGGAITDIVQAVTLRELVVGTDHVWWTSEPDDVQRIPIDTMGADAGAADLLTGTGTDLPNGITSDGAKIYWVYRATGSIKGADLDLKNPYEITNTFTPWDIEVSGNSVFWTELGDVAPPVVNVPRVMMAPKAGGVEPVVIATNQSGPHGIAVDATYVYWANSGDGTIHKAPLAGGADTVLASGQMKPEKVAVDAKYVYWTDPKADLVVRVAK